MDTCTSGIHQQTPCPPTLANDMWAHDGHSWAEVDQGDTLPHASAYNTITYDAGRDSLVLVTMTSDDTLIQTWEFGLFPIGN